MQSEALFGSIDLRITPFIITYDGTIDISSVRPKSIKRAPGILDDSTFRYILHLPVEASSSDAQNFPAERQRLEWTFLLKKYASKPMELQAGGRVPWPWRLAFLPLLVALPVYFLLKRMRKNRTLRMQTRPGAS